MNTNKPDLEILGFLDGTGHVTDTMITSIKNAIDSGAFNPYDDIKIQHVEQAEWVRIIVGYRGNKYIIHLEPFCCDVTKSYTFEMNDALSKFMEEPTEDRKVQDCSTIELFKVIRDRANGKN